MSNKAVLFCGMVDATTFTTTLQQPVPRHNEIDNALARHIKKYLGLQV